MVEVLLVTPVRMLRDALTAALTAKTERVVARHAGTADEALAQAVVHPPDLGLLDYAVGRPGDLVEALGRLVPRTRWIGLGIRPVDHDDDVLRCAEAGMVGFVDSEQAFADLEQAVRVVLAGGACSSPRTSALLLRGLRRRPLPPRVVRPGPDSRPALTPREQVVADLMSVGLTNRQIAARLVIGEATVKTHVHSVLAKLGLRCRAELTPSP
ncbi:DNA-binding response regulator [Desertihabitans brevis]|uniref:DNA-binding response regulator n=1 Tax=Desertihabitans brevis TaxID=2268447 RepID=A0A367YU42_9ACTN|nr:response regulator transcription factor [Desertihabitans brevis]RCK69310.1 DNA-binding response regulator [Desertihabitans brevis]